MIDLVKVFVLGSAVFVGLGGGWVVTVAQWRPRSWACWVYWSFVVGVATVSAAWSWALGTVGGFGLAVALCVVTGVVGWILALRQGGWTSFRHHATFGLGRLEVVALLFVLGVMIAPGLAGWHQTLAYRIGPDAFGNAVAAQALATGETIESIEHEIVAATGVRTIDEAVDQQTKLLYSAPSMRTQVRAEFIVAGLRWGYSGAAALLLRIQGPSDVWAVLTLLPVLAAMIAALGVASLLRREGVAEWKRVVALLLSVAAVSLLNGYREGGLAQLWVLPCIVACAWALLDRSLPGRCRAAMAGLGICGILPAYSDAVFVLGAIVAASFGLGVVLRDRHARSSAGWVTAGFLVGAAATGPYMLRFVAYIPRRLQDSQVGGWSMPRWTSPSETIGLFNSYDQRGPAGIVPRSMALQVGVGVVDAIVIGLTVGAMIRTWRHSGSRLLAAVSLVLFAVFVKSRYLDHASNYQYFKAAGMLAPIVGLALVMVWSARGASGSPAQRRAFDGLTLFAGIACVVSTVGYTRTFISESTRIGQDRIASSSSSRTQRLLESRNVLLPFRMDRLDSFTLLPNVDLVWFGRPTAEIRQRPDERESLVPSWVVTEADCVDWRCLQRVDPARVNVVDSHTRLVDLASSSEEFFALTGEMLNSEMYRVASDMSLRIGGPSILPGFFPGPNLLSNPVQSQGR